MDFLDTSGYAIIPVESPALPIDSSPQAGDKRPLNNLKITQTLDERQADEGKLILEIKATAQGLVPNLEEILDLGPVGFDLVEPEDENVSVSQFDPDSDDTVIVSERSWMVTMHAQTNLPERPTTFQFGEPKLAVAENIYQRYDDADLLSVDRNISLLEKYGETNYAWLWPVMALLAAGLVTVLLVVLSPRRTQQTAAPRFALPDEITPFTVLGLLRQIERNNGFDVNRKQELATCISRLEQHYFLQVDGEEPGLEDILTSGSRRSNEVETEVVSIQSRFLEDHIVGLVGWRDDKSTTWENIGSTEAGALMPPLFSGMRYYRFRQSGSSCKYIWWAHFILKQNDYDLVTGVTLGRHFCLGVDILPFTCSNRCIFPG